MLHADRLRPFSLMQVGAQKLIIIALAAAAYDNALVDACGGRRLGRHGRAAFDQARTGLAAAPSGRSGI